MLMVRLFEYNFVSVFFYPDLQQGIPFIGWQCTHLLKAETILEKIWVHISGAGSTLFTSVFCGFSHLNIFPVKDISSSLKLSPLSSRKRQRFAAYALSGMMRTTTPHPLQFLVFTLPLSEACVVGKVFRSNSFLNVHHWHTENLREKTETEPPTVVLAIPRVKACSSDSRHVLCVQGCLCLSWPKALKLAD